MKVQAIIAVAFFASCVSVVPTFANVRVQAIHRSSQRVRLTVLHERVAVRNAKIEIFDGDDRLQQIALSTDDAGVASLPMLKPGKYHVVASTNAGLHADLFLDISKNGRKMTSFFMDLFVEPPPPLAFEQRLAEIEKTGTAAQLSEFDGVVKDQSGAPIARTKVQVFHRGAFADGPVTTTSTDMTGAFSSHLVSGHYTASFSSPGFSPKITVFDIAQDSDKRNLQIVLNVAPSAE